jgi:hypothetical protein
MNGQAVAESGSQAAAFACAACGELAGIVRLVPAGDAADMGPPIGEEIYDADGVAIEGCLGNSWQRVTRITWRKVPRNTRGSRAGRRRVARDPLGAGTVLVPHVPTLPLP